MKNTLKKKTALKLFNIFSFIFLFGLQLVNGQGIVINDNTSKKTIALPDAIDPARYEKIMIVNLKVGQCFSDDRGFNSFLKYYAIKPGVNNFSNLGAEINFIKKKLIYGFKTDFMLQNTSTKPTLWHKNFQLKVGKTLIRQKGLILTVNANIGSQTSTIKFGNSGTPDFLANLSYASLDSKLFQSQFIFGPNISINKIFDKHNQGKGFSIGLESGVNFAAKTPHWKYGYYDSDGSFIGESITDMPLAGRQHIYSTLKIGFWSAR